MEVLLLGLAAVVATLGGGLAFGYARKGRTHRQWQAALTEAAALVPGARTSPGTRYDGPELRAELDGHTVSLRVTGSGALGRARATVALGERAPPTRIWLGWDVETTPSDWLHVPETSAGSGRFEGSIRARGDDAAAAARVIERAQLDLVDVRREARAHGVSLGIRGGYLELEVHGLDPSPYLLERLVRVAARLAEDVPTWTEATRIGAGAPHSAGR